LEINDQGEASNDQIDDEVSSIQTFSIDYQTVAELKFNALVRNLKNQCIKITDLNKYDRRVLHAELVETN
jgi:hypothetical protein